LYADGMAWVVSKREQNYRFNELFVRNVRTDMAVAFQTKPMSLIVLWELP
jgi:hypothetical protein